MKLKVTVNGISYDVDVEVEEEKRTLGSLNIGGLNSPTAPTTASVQGGSSSAVTAPLAGSVSKILVSAGESISSGQVVIVLEAMKMETEITAPVDGTVANILVSPGDAVQGGQVLLEIGK